MIRILLLVEWKRLYRSPLILFIIAFYITVGIYSVHYGSAITTRQKTIIDSLNKDYSDKIRLSINKLQADTLTKQGKAEFNRASEPSSVNYNIKSYSVFPFNRFSALAIGQRDILPYYRQISTERSFSQTYAPDIQNPEVLGEGNIDLSFVIVYLLPLLMIGITYNIFAEEIENGTFSILAVQVGNSTHLILSKLAIRLFFVLIAVTIPCIYGVIFIDAISIHYVDLALRWGTTVYLYFAFWAALCCLIIITAHTSTRTVFYMFGSWLSLVVLLPSAFNLYVDWLYPNFLKADMASEQRKIEEDVWSIAPKDLIWNFYERHPEYKIGNISDTSQYSPRRFAAYYDEMERRLYPIERKFNDRIIQRNKLMSQFSDVLPSLCTQKSFNQIAQSDFASFKYFEESSVDYQKIWQNYLYQFIFNDENFDANDYKRLPVYRYPQNRLADSGFLLMMLYTLIVIAITIYITNANKQKIKK